MSISRQNQVVSGDIRAVLASPLPWHQFSGKTVCVTGAAGLVGSYVVWCLLDLNRTLPSPVTVIATGRDSDRLLEKLGPDPHLKVLNLPLDGSVELDFTAQYVVHCASPSRTSQHRNDPLGTIAPNVLGTQALLEMASRSHVEGFLFISSGAVYGQPVLAQGERVEESLSANYDHLQTTMSYAESKRMGEFLCHAWAMQKQMPTTMARLGHTYGPGLEESDERIFADFVFRILKNEPLIIKSAGTAVRPFCYISDAISALFTILLKGAKGEAYNVANTRNEYAISDLAQTLRNTFSERDLKVEILGEASHSFQSNILLSTDKLEGLGWMPVVSVPEGFRRTVESFESDR